MEYNEEFEGMNALPRIKNMPITRPFRGGKEKLKVKKSKNSELDRLIEQRDEIREYNFTYDASRHEREWIIRSLSPFHDMQWFSDILRLVKGGKEASVYQCLATADSAVKGDFIAAKVYRPRRFRNLRNDHLYREGRAELDESGVPIYKEKMVKAIHQKSDYGREVMHTSWLEHEYKTMRILHAAGADMPAPYASGNNAILMEFIGDSVGAAPNLNSVKLDRSEAGYLFERVLFNIELMLANQRVHADLSAYNILYWDGDIFIIDFPQAVSPLENQSAYVIFERDMRRICEYFSRQGIKSDSHKLAERLWSVYKYSRIPEIDLEYLDEDDEGDRAFWSQHKGT